MKNLMFVAIVLAASLVIGCGDDEPQHRFDGSLALADGTSLPPSVVPALDADILTQRGDAPPDLDEEAEASEEGEEEAESTDTEMSEEEPAEEEAEETEPEEAPAPRPVKAKRPRPNRSFGGTPLTESMTGLGVQSELTGGGSNARPPRKPTAAPSKPKAKPKKPAPAKAEASELATEPKAAGAEPTGAAPADQEEGGAITSFLRRGVRSITRIGSSSAEPTESAEPMQPMQPMQPMGADDDLASEPVVAEGATVAPGVTSGLTLVLKKPDMFYDVEDPSGLALVATVELASPQAATATAYGFIKVAAATDDKGNKLQPIKNSFRDDTKEYVKIDDFMRSMRGGSKDKVTFDIVLPMPPADAKQLARLEGSVRVLLGGKREDVVIAGVRAGKPGTELEHNTLEQAGVTIKLFDPKSGDGDPDTMVALEVVDPKMSLVELALVDKSGKKLDSSSSTSTSDATTHHVLQADEKLPADTQLKLTVAVGQKPVDVPFKFAAVPLPKKR